MVRRNLVAQPGRNDTGGQNVSPHNLIITTGIPTQNTFLENSRNSFVEDIQCSKLWREPAPPVVQSSRPRHVNLTQIRSPYNLISLLLANENFQHTPLFPDPGGTCVIPQEISEPATSKTFIWRFIYQNRFQTRKLLSLLSSRTFYEC